MGRVINRRTSAYKPAATTMSIDRWCNMAAQISQVLLLALGVFGYFYTVLPVYQKAVLDEDIAQKILEVRQQERRILDLNAQIASREEALAAKDKELFNKDRDLAAVREQASAARAEARTNYSKLRVEYLGGLVASVRQCPSSFLQGQLDGAELRRCPQHVAQQAAYLFSQLEPSDARSLRTLISKHVTAAEPDYQKLVARFRVEAEQAKNDIARLKKEMDDNKAAGEAAKNENRPFPPGHFLASAKAFSAWSQATLHEVDVRGSASAEYSKLLGSIGERIVRDFR